VEPDLTLSGPDPSITSPAELDLIESYNTIVSASIPRLPQNALTFSSEDDLRTDSASLSFSYSNVYPVLNAIDTLKGLYICLHHGKLFLP